MRIDAAMDRWDLVIAASVVAIALALLIGCTPAPCIKPIVQIDRPLLPEVKAGELESISADAYTRLLLRDRLLHEYAPTRTFKPERNYFGQPTEGPIARPLQISVWYPAKPAPGQNRMKLQEYHQAMATETDFAPPSPERLAILMNRLKNIWPIEFRVPPEGRGAIREKIASAGPAENLLVADGVPCDREDVIRAGDIARCTGTECTAEWEGRRSVFTSPLFLLPPYRTPLLLAAATLQSPVISAERIREDVRVLASDDFAGRGPGETGEQKTIEFLSKAFAAAGLEPGGVDGLWTQPVSLVRLDRLPGARLSLSLPGGDMPLAVGEQVTLALRNVGRTDVAKAPLVFGGYGIVDPVRGWDAYAGVDVRGKVVVVLANDPDFEAGQDLGFEGRRMVVAGRVGSKFESAAKAGALGVLVIHEDAAASYPFSQVSSGDALPAFVLAPHKPSTLHLSGWLRHDVALALLARIGQQLDALKRQARSPAFRAFPMQGASLGASGEVKATDVVSHNVFARTRGATRPDEYVLYSGLVQGLMYTYALDSMHANAMCGGNLFWMYEDCWGEVGWTIVDYELRRKVAWYYVKRACAPIRLILRKRENYREAFAGFDPEKVARFGRRDGAIGSRRLSRP
mgnify:CR=1 FL=1